MHGIRQSVCKRKIIESDYPICGNCMNCVKRAANYYYCKRRKSLQKGSNRFGEGHVYKTDRACYHYKLFEETEIELTDQERELLKQKRHKRNINNNG